MTKSQIKILLVNIFSVVCGCTICIWILVPFFSALFLAALFLIPLGAIGKSNILLIELLATSMLCAAAFCASGFLMALLISYFSRNREIIATLFSVLIVGIFYVIQEFVTVVPGQSQVYKAYRLLEATIEVIFLFTSAIFISWLIARRRRLKVQKET